MKKPAATLTLSKQTLKSLKVRSSVQAGMTAGPIAPPSARLCPPR